jgi:hypothetical protein
MNHKIIRPLLLAALLAAGAAASAQQTDGRILEDQRLTEARALLQSGRKEIIADELRLTDEEASAFWPVYEEYHSNVMVVRDRYAETIGDYIKTYRAGEITDDYAENLIDQGLSFKGDLLKIQEKYLNKFKKVLPIRKAVRFYQLENKMDADIDAQLANFVPLMEDM